MEEWKEIFEGVVPKNNYTVEVKNGDKNGLTICLESDTHSVKVFFGNVSALRMLDEGVVLNELFNNDSIEEFKKDSFSNSIYMLTNSEFEFF